ncbi:hypothetical protein HPB48_000268 [Haemaphysalis longicornis]|uniref:Receptor ligand binding region domain-containing protein n=1 Tax=Haemaphysalis longicornis TaxID=44386 RepID=A0A9J6FGS3_HAELO|nr:hypothetical protein HPB48_000268 [Haemaphysalis longicornis]
MAPLNSEVTHAHQAAKLTGGGVAVLVVLGQYFEHIGLMASLEARGLLQGGEYFVVGVDVQQYDLEEPARYLTASFFYPPGASKTRATTMQIPSEGAYLYDAVMVYARALNACLAHGGDLRNGKHLFEHMRGRSYQSAYTVTSQK